MAETSTPTNSQEAAETTPAPAPGGGRSPDEIALDLMKFIAATTGYGKGASGSAGFSGKPGSKSPEDQADSLIELFQRCRKVVKEE
jgi:hypothetical protein